jgi:cytochrome c oxidase subunit 2
MIDGMPMIGQTLLAETSLWDRFWFRQSGSTFAPSTDALFFYIFWVSVFFFVLLMVAMVYFGYKYRRRPGVPAEVSPSHHTGLELTWSIVPAILMVVMFVWGAQGYLKKVVPPSDAQTIAVNAKKWNWTWTYPDGATSLQNERVADTDAPLFALPVDKPVQFLMSSQDVIHSFYIPGFRIKRDVFPNRYTKVWAHPTVATHEWDPVSKRAVLMEGATPFYLLCAEYCGDQHSQMANIVAVMPQADYEAWVAEQKNTDSIPLVELGSILYKAKGCATCHGITDGAVGTGPTWYGIWGQTHQFTNAPPAVVDENYIRESILNPGAKILTGYANQMPQYQGQLTDRELKALAFYIKSLTPEFAAEAEQQSIEEMEQRESGGDGEEADAAEDESEM